MDRGPRGSRVGRAPKRDYRRARAIRRDDRPCCSSRQRRSRAAAGRERRRHCDPHRARTRVRAAGSRARSTLATHPRARVDRRRCVRRRRGSASCREVTTRSGRYRGRRSRRPDSRPPAPGNRRRSPGVSGAHAGPDRGRPHIGGGGSQPGTPVCRVSARRSRHSVRARRAGSLPRSRTLRRHAYDRFRRRDRSSAGHGSARATRESDGGAHRLSGHQRRWCVPHARQHLLLGSSGERMDSAAGPHPRRRPVRSRRGRSDRPRAPTCAPVQACAASTALASRRLGVRRMHRGDRSDWWDPAERRPAPAGPILSVLRTTSGLRARRSAIGVRSRMARRATTPRAGSARDARRAARRIRRRSHDARRRRDRARRASALRARVRAAVALRVALAPTRRPPRHTSRRLRDGPARSDSRTAAARGTSSDCRCSTRCCT